MKKILLFLLFACFSLSFAQTVSVDLTASTGTYTVPQGVNSLTAEAWGGGGGGGRSTDNGVATGGGGGGAYARKLITVSGGSVVSYKVGRGGNGGTAAVNNGGDTWFSNVSTVLAKGGLGAVLNENAGATGGQASASVGDVKYNGGNGGNGSGNWGWDAAGGGGGAARITGNGGNGENGRSINIGGAGGASTNPGGAGGTGTSQGGVGQAGNVYGGGGGGSKRAWFGTGGDRDGGAGAQGLIRVSFIKPAITINANPSLTICSGSSVTLTASSAGAYSYTWSNGETGNSITVSPGTTTTYTVTGTASNGAGGTFTHTQTVTVTVNPVVSAGTISGTSPLFIGDVTTYSSNGAAGGTWSSSDVNVFTVDPSTGVVTAQGAGSATITYTVNSCGGPNSTTATVVVTDVTTWYGAPDTGSWDHGVPTAIKKAAIAGSYRTSKGGDFTAKELTVKTGGSLLIESNGAVTVVNEITNNGTFIVESDGNLKQINNVTNTTPITVRRNHTLTDARKEYNFLSSPVANQVMKSIFGNNSANVPFVTVLRESTNTFVNATAADYAIPGKGFSVKEPKLEYVDLSGQALPVNVAQYQGVPNNGTISPSITRTYASRGWNLIGNPYPSNLDLKEFYDNNQTNMQPEFRFWDNTVNDIYTQMGGAYQGYSYAIFNAVTGTDGYGIAAPGKGGVDENGDPYPAGTKIPGRVVKVSQGFMVRAIATSAQVTFENSMRRTTQDYTEFFGKTSPKNRYRLQLLKSDGFTIQNAVAYFETGNQNFGIEDTQLPNASASDALFTYADDKKVVINGRNSFATTDVLQLGARHYTAGTYKIQAVDEEGVFANGQAIYLKDKQLNVITDLTQGDYTFTSEAGTFSDRFEIVYQPETVLATEGTTKASLEVYRDAGDFVIRSSEKAIELMELYDASGRLVLSQKGNGKELRFAATTLAEGIYVVKTRLKDGQEFTKKIRK